MSLDSHDFTERARKNERMVLRAFAERGKQQEIAEKLKISDSTVSRFKDENIERFSTVLAILGLKIVSMDRVCVRADEYKMMTSIAARALANEQMAKQLLFDDPE